MVVVSRLENAKIGLRGVRVVARGIVRGVGRLVEAQLFGMT
jgi:hypothetical protein